MPQAGPLTQPPDSVIAARLLLALVFAVTVYGCLAFSRSFLSGASPTDDFLTVNWNLVLAIASSFAFWAIGKRRPAGRWVAIAVFGAVIFGSIPVYLFALRGGDGPLAGVVILHVVLGLEINLLARGRNANRYFAPTNDPVLEP
jgi:hypothetical protein